MGRTRNWKREKRKKSLVVSFCLLKKIVPRGFPGGSVVPAKAGDVGLIPPPGRSHTLQSDYTCATTTELVLQSRGAPRLSPCTCAATAQVLTLESVLHRRRTHHWAARTLTSECPHAAATAEKPRQQQRPTTARNYLLNWRIFFLRKRIPSTKQDWFCVLNLITLNQSMRNQGTRPIHWRTKSYSGQAFTWKQVMGSGKTEN